MKHEYMGLVRTAQRSTEKAKRIAFTMEAYLAYRPSEGIWLELEREIERCALALTAEIRAN